MKVGAEPKKIWTLVALLAAALAIFYYQFSSGPQAAAPAARPAPPPAARQIRSAAEQILEGGAVRARNNNQRINNDFKPTLKRTKQGQTLDASKVDPTLRMDLLAKVQSAGYEGVERNLFLFGAAKPKTPPPPPPSEAKRLTPDPGAKPIGSGPAAAPSKPPPPPITMKYFGFANRQGDARKRAFFMDGEEIYVAAEGEVIKKRYKIVRVGINSVVVEDLDYKSQQTLPLQES